PLTAAAMRMLRNPREAELHYLNAPGLQRLTQDLTVPGGLRLIEAGEMMESDDGTPNIPLWIPFNRDGSDNKCIRNFKVLLARFQLLPVIDVGTGFLAYYMVTARPRSSYRAEDIGSLIHGVNRAHGIFQQCRFEGGAWQSNLVKHIVKTMGARMIHVHSPHNKPFIEIFFNILWTKLSVHFPGLDVGRFRGENRDANLLLAACQAGSKDPRKYFPSLDLFLQCVEAAVFEYNRTPLRTKYHNAWVPEERWHEEKSRHLRKYDPATAWLYAPIIRQIKVQGSNVETRIPMFEGVPSVPFSFSAPEL